MTKQQALRIIKFLKEGRGYKNGHYHYGYLYYNYNEGFIIEKREDFSMNIFEPTITTNQICVEEFIEILENEFEFDEFKNNLI